MSDINVVLKKQIEKIKIPEEELKNIKDISDKFCLDLDKKLKSKKIKAEVFVGGSLAKNTLIKTDANKYDVDVFVRFDRDYNSDKISSVLGNVLSGFKKIHGSRDYYQKNIGNVTIEVIPVIKIKNPEDALNITDLSYFHVNYVLKQVKKNSKLGDEIRLAKAFCHGLDCYGAESYIRGFSGYALELLIINYGSFLKFIKVISENKEEKIFVDTEKLYKNKNQISMELNESKLQSPIILVDPTFKTRNACSSLSKETFDKFKKSCNEFIKKPSVEFFIKKNVLEEFKGAKGIITIIIKTHKQAGDIAGTKSRKFFNFFLNQIKREFVIKKSGFEYHDMDNIAKGYFILDKKKDEVVKGPDITKVEHLKSFREKHPNAFIKNHVCYAEVKHELKFEDFFKKFLEKDKKIIMEMGISELKLG